MQFFIIDDNPHIRTELRRILEKQCVSEPDQIEETGDAVTALQLVFSTDYDLVLLDLSLGEQNGLKVLRQIREERPEQQVLVVSMHPREIYEPICIKMGAAGYLEKHRAMLELPGMVANIVAKGSKQKFTRGYTAPSTNRKQIQK
ncbi:MAG: response regulator transcription factor [Desulfuromonadales bacterium]